MDRDRPDLFPQVLTVTAFQLFPFDRGTAFIAIFKTEIVPVDVQLKNGPIVIPGRDRILLERFAMPWIPQMQKGVLKIQTVRGMNRHMVHSPTLLCANGSIPRIIFSMPRKTPINA